jgi:hypothetical protein
MLSDMPSSQQGAWDPAPPAPPKHDVRGLCGTARPIVDRVADVYARHFGRRLVGLVAKGSAVNGDYIAGCSDIDLHLYLDDAAFDARGIVPFAVQVAVHRELQKIETWPFAYVQGIALRCEPPPGWVGPIPGMYHVVAGRNPTPEATPEDLRASAKAALDALDPPPAYLREALLDSGAGRVGRLVRLLVTADYWPTVRHLLIARGREPLAAWQMRKADAVAALDGGSEAGRHARAVFDALQAFYPAAVDVDRGLAMLEHGVAFLAAAKREAAR